MTNLQSRNFHRKPAIDLVDSEFAEDVTEWITHLEEHKDVIWKPLGDEENNYGIVKNQTGHPIAALGEIIINSFDAILLKNYRDQEVERCFDSMSEAVDALVDEDEEQVQLRAQGEKSMEGDRVSFTVYDSGMGQRPERFEDTFVGLLEPGMVKQGLDFVQGKYGMGSSGVLPFCDNGYKLILSSSFEQPNVWSWTIIREKRDENQFQYLTFDGDIPQFEGEVKGKDSGTFVKMFNYDVGDGVSSSKIADIGTFKKKLERYLVKTPLPIELYDPRYESSAVVQTQTSGLVDSIENREVLKNRYTIQYDFDSEELGERDIEIFLFKEDSELEEGRGDRGQRTKSGEFTGGDIHRRQAVLLCINGQTHGDFGKSFLKNQCNLYNTAQDVIVRVDMTDLPSATMSDLFKPSRDRLAEDDLASELKAGLRKAIKNDDTLEHEENQRKVSTAKDKQDTAYSELVNQTLEETPEMAEFLGDGDRGERRTPTPGGDEQRDEPEGPPTYLKLIKNYRSDDWDYWNEAGENKYYEKKVPVNRKEYLRFELDAPNDYLDADDGGEIRIEPQVVQKSSRLSNGLLTLQIQAREQDEPGDVRPMMVIVERENGAALTQHIEIQYTEPVTPSDDGGNGGGGDDNRSNTDGVAIPEPNPVREENWGVYEMDQHDIAIIQDRSDTTPNSWEDVDIEKLEVCVNMDATPLINFLDRHAFRKNAKDEVEQMYKMSVVFYALGIYKTALDAEYVQDESPENVTRTALRGLGPSLLPTLIPPDRVDSLTH